MTQPARLGACLILVAVLTLGAACAALAGANSPRYMDRSGNLNFGNVAVGDWAQLPLTISNTGNDVMTVAGTSYPLCFTGAWSGTILPGQSATVMVTFSPTSPQQYARVIAVDANETAGSDTVTATATAYIGSPVNSSGAVHPARESGLTSETAGLQMLDPVDVDGETQGTGRPRERNERARLAQEFASRLRPFVATELPGWKLMLESAFDGRTGMTWRFEGEGDESILLDWHLNESPEAAAEILRLRLMTVQTSGTKIKEFGDEAVEYRNRSGGCYLYFRVGIVTANVTAPSQSVARRIAGLLLKELRAHLNER